MPSPMPQDLTTSVYPELPWVPAGREGLVLICRFHKAVALFSGYGAPLWATQDVTRGRGGESSLPSVA